MCANDIGTNETNQNTTLVSDLQKPDILLEEIYQKAMLSVGSEAKIRSDITEKSLNDLQIIISKSESSKGVLTVLITSLLYKILYPQQDIRNHQTSIPEGYSGRTFDSNYVTPFLKKQNFPSMAESGWLTRSLEQKRPYDLSYPGAINPKPVKDAFLSLLDQVQKGSDCLKLLDALFQGLIIQRNSQIIDLAKPTALTIGTILSILDIHFHENYVAEGASRLPTLAIYAAYACLVKEIKRFEGKTLLPIANHTSADTRSGRIGDVDLIDENERSFEAVEVKFGISINLGLVQDAYKKFITTPVDRFYLLSTAETSAEEMAKISEEIVKIKNTHGCQVIVNGIMPTIKYYLRLLNNTYEFIENYVNLLENDKSIKFEHKERWNELIGGMSK